MLMSKRGMIDSHTAVQGPKTKTLDGLSFDYKEVFVTWVFVSRIYSVYIMQVHVCEQYTQNDKFIIARSNKPAESNIISFRSSILGHSQFVSILGPATRKTRVPLIHTGPCASNLLRNVFFSSGEETDPCTGED